MKTPTAFAVALFTLLPACGDAPLQSIGERSSEWINEPEIVATTVLTVPAPTSIDSKILQWSNDDIVTENLGDRAALISEVFSRREGDRFIQASRYEIATALPDVMFPALAPFGAEWVSSQLVIENSGELSDNPSAAFGIWSVEPYTRSRSVAQMAILRVASDQETATEVAQNGDISCARFAERITDQCHIITVNDRSIWRLTSASGTTLIWFDNAYRYELYGRTWVAAEVLVDMAGESIGLDQLSAPTS